MSDRYTLHVGDARAVLDTLPADSFDAMLCDPPYGLSFMGKAWDHGVPSVDLWRAALRVLKPGAPLLAFGGTRTFHRLAVAIEDAGFEIRDTLCWMYGSGFPKSLDVSKAIDAAAGAEREVVGNYPVTREFKGRDLVGDQSHATRVDVTAPATPLAAQWDGYGTSLKPAWEPCILARKPLDGTVAGTVAGNVWWWGVGGLAIDACRIGYESEDDMAAAAAAAAQRLGHPKHGAGVGDFGLHSVGAAASLQPYLDRQHLGRWPSNVILDEAAAAQLDAEAGEHPGMSGGGKHASGYRGGMFGGIDSTATARGDSGGASRFFYCAKVSAAEREIGCEALPLREFCQGYAGDVDASPDRAGDLGLNRIKRIRNQHPTLKPVALTRYLARLVLPPPGRERRIVVPFAGAGSEMIGALLAGWEHVEGVELSEEYATIARARLKVAIERPGMFDAEARATAVADDPRQGSLFG